MTKEEFIEKYKDLLKDGWAHPDVGDGWLPLLDKLCGMIEDKIDTIFKYNDKWLVNEVITNEEHEVNKKFLEDFKIVQIKEKFGGLRFYVNGATLDIGGWIRFAESMSYDLCEDCGVNQGLGSTSGWVKTICEPCAIKIGKGEGWMTKEAIITSRRIELEEYSKVNNNNK